MDAAYPFGTYTAHALNTVTSATNSDTISYTQDAYPSTQAVVTSATFTGLQGMNPNAPFTIDYNGFTAGAGTTPGQSFEFIDIFNSMGADVFSQSFLPNTQTSVTIPAGTLMPGMAYTLSVDYSDRIQGTSTTGTKHSFRLWDRPQLHDSDSGGTRTLNGLTARGHSRRAGFGRFLAKRAPDLIGLCRRAIAGRRQQALGGNVLVRLESSRMPGVGVDKFVRTG